MLHAKYINFRLLRYADLPLLHDWLNHKFIMKWYGSRPITYLEIEREYLPRIKQQEPMLSYIIQYRQIPIGYIQTYRLADYPEYTTHLDIQEDAAGTDMFIGEREYRYQGLGSSIIKTFLKLVVFQQWPVASCIIAPRVENTSAINMYKKAGFTYLKTVSCPAAEGQQKYLMRIARDAILP